ncbi:MAG: hypothetical protein M3R36_03825 [Bacteroidota bacterium]|nr:hypothetical protein [Bacteroidota bacterium]
MIRYFLIFLILFVIIHSDTNAQDSISPPDPNVPTKVFVSMILNNISDINAATQIMKTDVFFRVRWNDPRLAHKSGHRTIKNIDEIWDPWLTFSNRLNITKAFPEIVTVLNDGTVIYMQRVYGDFSQDFHLKDFPFDRQIFKIGMVAIGLSASEVEILPDSESESGISERFILPDWKILDWKYDNSSYSYLKTSPPLPSISFMFTAKRQGGFYILIYVIPLILIIMMSWMVFWLGPKLAAPQIAVATTSMLTLIAYRFVVSGNLPKISYMTRMDIFVLCSSILIFFTLINAVITTTLASRGDEKTALKIDFHCRWIFPLLYVIVCLVAFTP